MATVVGVAGIEWNAGPSSLSPSKSPFGMAAVDSLGFQGQRFPESCQRTSLQEEDNEDVDIAMDDDDDDCNYYDSYAEPTMGRRHLQLPSEPSPFPRIMAEDSDRITPDWELPALTDSDSSSDSASSVGPPSPQLQQSWPRCEPVQLVEKQPPLSERTGEPIRKYFRGKTTITNKPEPASSSSTVLPSRPDQQLQNHEDDLGDHACFSKVVVTKFSNPPRYKLKKVKFHQCPICQKSFPRPSGLRTHMNMHTKTKPHVCPYQGCDKSFSVISNAKRHHRTHLVDLPAEQSLPSGPYNVDFSDPVVVSSDPPPFCPSPSGSAPFSSSSDSSRSTYCDSISGSTPSSLNSKGCNRRGSRGVTLRWLPPGGDVRAPWRAGKASLGVAYELSTGSQVISHTKLDIPLRMWLMG